LFVAKAEALPADVSIPEGTLVFVPGISTWKRLTERGVWVSGCADGLGEDEAEFAGLCAALGVSGQILKLTHTGGLHTENTNTVATYELQPTQEDLKVAGFSHFFWKSGSTFLELIKRYPSLRECHHACGLGHTAALVQRELGPGKAVGVYQSFEHFLSKVLPASNSKHAGTARESSL
ncbi:MAG: hypothetical protein EBZ48_13725, partial [Proteobacteria bacterium]|nr:hypothetical protein [Pseudomonadota bacterium]